MPNLRDRKKGVKVFWIISYLVVFLLPLIMGLLAVSIIYNGLKEQISERNTIVLDSVSGTFDSHFEAVVESMMQLYNDRDANNIGTNISVPLSREEKNALYEFAKHVKDIRGYETLTNYSDTFFIYFSNLDYVFMSDYAQPSELFYGAHINSDEYDLEKWNDFITGKYDNMFFNDKLLSDRDELFFIHTFPMKLNENNYFNAVYKINTRKILSEVKKLYLYEYGEFSITNSEGECLVNTYPDGSEAKNLSSGDVLTFTKSSKVTGWEYVYTLPKSKAYGDVYKIIAWLIIIYILCFLGGLWLIGYFTKLNYRPIDKMINLFKGNARKIDSNEYSYLSERIAESLARNIALNTALDNQSRMIHEHLIGQLLLGNKAVGKRSRTEVENINFDLENDFFAVMLYSADKNDDEELSIKQFVLTNVTDELFNNEGYTFTNTKKEDVVYIIAAKQPFSVSKIKEISDFLLSFTKKEFGFEFFSAIGSWYQGDKAISKSYNEAKRAVEYAIASDSKEFTEYGNISASIKDGYLYSIEIETQLVNLLKASESEKLLLVINDIFRRNTENDFSIDNIRYLTIEVFSTLKRVMQQYGYSTEYEYPEECEFIKNIFDCRDVNEMQSIICKTYKSCAENIFRQTSKKDDLVNNVILYINQNYSNQNLTATMIGDAFSMNGHYVSRKFREQTGKTINDFLKELRINKAKELLENSDELIADVAEMVGFTSYRTFVRLFTEVVGVTPNKYKQMK